MLTFSSSIKLLFLYFQLKNLLDSVPGFQGFEAVCYVRGELYFLIEAEVSRIMSSYLTKGTFDETKKEIIIDENHLIKIEPPSNLFLYST